jgi:photosystem II stability/assembly factor-like uncharacterized protein
MSKSALPLRLGFLLLALAWTHPDGVLGDAGVWTALGPAGSGVTSVAVDTLAPATIYAAGLELFKSTDSGRTWEALEVPSRAPYFRVFVDPAATGTVYLADGSESLFKSMDGGKSWRYATPERNGLVVALAFDPRSPATVYAGMYGYGCEQPCLHKSSDGGGTWSALDVSPPYLDVAALTVDPGSGTLYVGAYGRGVLKSVGGTGALTAINSGLGTDSVGALAVDPRTGTVYAGDGNEGRDDVSRSADGGETWTGAGPGLGGIQGVSVLAVDSRTNPSTIYAGGEGGVFRSRDGGDRWERVSNGLPDSYVYSLALAETNPPTLYAGTTDGVYALGLEELTGPPPESYSYLVPTSAHAPGANGAFFTTDLSVANVGATDAHFTIQFLSHDMDGRTGPTSSLLLAPRRAVTYEDVLASVFEVVSGYGAVRITSDSAFLKVASQTSTAPPDGRGTVGQSIPSFDASRFATPASPQTLIGLRRDAAFRTNVVLVNASEVRASVVLTLVGSDGSTFGSAAYDLPPLAMTQVPSAVTALGAPAGTRDAVLVVSILTPGAQVAALATVIDNLTNDPRTVLP